MIRPPESTMFLWVVTVLRLCLCLCIGFPSTFGYSELSQKELASLVSYRDPAVSLDFNDPSSHLSRILIPRPPGTENNTIVRNYIVSRLKALNWDIEEDSFTDPTPYGEKRFTNIIATKNPKALRRVILSAHFDSKFFATYPLNQFVGATDSAAPCAILLDVAETLNGPLDRRDANEDLEDDGDEDTTLQLVFFDGEEAFQDWTENDSLYGSRHLAEKWESEYVVPNPNRRRRLTPGQTKLSTIELLILLDLLGTRNPHISSYFLTTGWLFDKLISVEDRLHVLEYFPSESDGDEMESFFNKRVGNQVNGGGIDDDHRPFLKRGVSVLHVISTPFPHVWHKLSDDASALDLLTLKKWSLIFRVFIAEYLHLEPNTNASSSRDPADLVRSTKSRETQPLITYLVAVLNSIFHLLYHLLFAIRKTDDAK